MEQYNYMPIGTVVSYAGVTTPIGWLLCDGRIIEEHEYPDLYRVLGSGVLPDLRGEFVRGLDNGRGLDEGRVLGSEQGDAIRNITGSFYTRGSNVHDTPNRTDTIVAKEGCFIGDEKYNYADTQSIQSNLNPFWREKIDFNSSLVVPTAEENRPKNVALNYIIKAFNTTTDTETLPIQMAKALNNKIENNYNDQLDATVDIVGKEFYDYIQNSGEKTAGKIYRDRLQKGIFRCLKTTTSVLNTSEFYEPISNNDLLDKLKDKVKVFKTGFLALPQGGYWYTLPSHITPDNVITVIPREYSSGLAKIRFVGTTKNSIELEVLQSGSTESLDIFYFV